MQTPPTPGALAAITTSASDGAVGDETAVIIALHPKMALREAIKHPSLPSAVLRERQGVSSDATTSLHSLMSPCCTFASDKECRRRERQGVSPATRRIFT
jgi:hypothetical protein